MRTKEKAMNDFEIRPVKDNEKFKQTFNRNRLAIGGTGALAIEFVKLAFAHGGIIEGENSDGSARPRPYTPAELVARATETADLLMADLERRGWAIESCTFDELVDDSRPAGFRSA